VIGGLQIIVSDHALKETDVRLFPESRHRSKRIRKKLVKRFGGEFKKVPCIYRVGDALVAHPVLYADLKHRVPSKPAEPGRLYAASRPGPVAAYLIGWPI